MDSKSKQTMRVLAIAFVYNELPYLPLAIEYYRKQGCELYVIDNYSNDGTYEWLLQNNIPCHRKDTNDAFQLEWLQQEMISTLHKLKPDWFLWFAPDLFHIMPIDITDFCALAQKKGFNQIKSKCFCFKNTGEEFQLPMFRQYHYAHINNAVKLISKYYKGLKIVADQITIPNMNIMNAGTILEYGGCKPKNVQEVKLKRREKAWKLGTPEGHGIHYKAGKKLNWIHDKKTLIDTTADKQVQQAIGVLEQVLLETQ